MFARSQHVLSADGTRLAIHSLGAGDPVLVVGGALGTAQDYLPLARALGRHFGVHVLDRRGRGESGPQGPRYGLDRECEDLAAAQAATGASRVFGHSFGGLVSLQAARRGLFEQVAVYEPAVSVRGSVPTDWLDAYERRLAAGDTRGAFGEFVRGSGHAPAALVRMPDWYVRLVLTVAIRRQAWQRMEPLLGSNLLEHREVARWDGQLSYRDLTAPVLLLAGSRSPRSQTATLTLLRDSLPHATLDLMEGLAHRAPQEKGAERVAERVAGFFSPPASALSSTARDRRPSGR